MKKTFLTACVLTSLGLATVANATETVRLENCGRMADSFSFVVDTSGSMMQRIDHVKAESENTQKRIEVAKAFITKTAEVVMQKTQWQSAVYSVAPYAELIKLEPRTPEDFKKALDERLNTNLEVFGRPTWLGQRGATKLGEQLDHAQAFVLITDGSFDVKTEGKQSPIGALQAFCQANPKSSVTVVSAAYSEEEKQAIEALVAANPKIQVYELETLMRDDAAFTSFVERVFYKDCSQVSTVEIQDVYFDFDKSSLREDSRATLEKAVDLIKQMKPERDVTIAGWTDWTGSDAYNAKLSEKRANAVKDFFVSEGLEAQRLEAVGNGESYKYDNHTKQGRQMNRRVELLFHDDKQE